jgi:hypothetical protein
MEPCLHGLAAGGLPVRHNFIPPVLSRESSLTGTERESEIERDREGERWERDRWEEGESPHCRRENTPLLVEGRDQSLGSRVGAKR